MTIDPSRFSKLLGELDKVAEEMKVTYRVIASEFALCNFQLQMGRSRTEVQVQRRKIGGWELGANYREFLGRATLDLNTNYKRGTGAFESLSSPEEAFGEGTSRFRLATADANFSLPFKLKEPIIIETKTGRRFKGVVAWSNGIRLGVQFDTALPRTDPLISSQ